MAHRRKGNVRCVIRVHNNGTGGVWETHTYYKKVKGPRQSKVEKSAIRAAQEDEAQYRRMIREASKAL